MAPVTSEVAAMAPVTSKVAQPDRKPGVVDVNGVYRNSFGRAGKYLHTEIVMRSGVLKELATLAQDLFPEPSLRAVNFLITDEIVDRLYGDLTLGGLREAGLAVYRIVVPADEHDAADEASAEPYKTSDTLMKCCDEVLANGVSKHSCIISLGGGVVNNLCGVVASMIYRGLRLFHITTTAMGMFDAALDFKQAVNHPLGKNLLGCYYPADAVLMDPECLLSLSECHVLNGIAEALKHGLAQSPALAEKIAGPLRDRGVAALRDAGYLEEVCQASVEIKCPTLDFYCSSDYNEMVPQYGHCVGHAVEHLSWSGPERQPLLHGQAICIGMCVSAEIASILGVCDPACVDAHYEIISACKLPTCVPASISLEAVCQKITMDKHFVKKPVMGLPAEIGRLAPCSMDNEEGAHSYAWVVDHAVLRAALVANASRREGIPAPPQHIVSLKTAFGVPAPSASCPTC